MSCHENYNGHNPAPKSSLRRRWWRSGIVWFCGLTAFAALIWLVRLRTTPSILNMLPLGLLLLCPLMHLVMHRGRHDDASSLKRTGIVAGPDNAEAEG